MNCCICNKEIIPTDENPNGHDAWPLGTGGVSVQDTGESNPMCCKGCYHDKVMIARVRHNAKRQQIFGR